MLFGNKRRAVASGSGGGAMPQPVTGAGDSSTDMLQGRSEPVSRLLNRAVLRQCPSEMERLLTRPDLPLSLAGIGDSMVWAVDEETSEVVWWRYKPGIAQSHNIGRVPLHRFHGGERARALIAYDVKRPGSANECESCLLVASAAGIQAVQLGAPLPQDDSDFKTWRGLNIEPGGTTLLCAETEDTHSTVILCNRPCELVVFRHDFLASDTGTALPSFFEIEPDVFDNRSPVSRLGLGNTSLGSTLRRFMGSQHESLPSSIMMTRAFPMAQGRRSVAGGRNLISVTILSQNDVYVWRLAPVDEARWNTDGYLRLEGTATRSRTALDAAPTNASPTTQQKQYALTKLVDMCMQCSRVVNGKWGNACLQVLALHADGQYHVHFLSPFDLEPLYSSQCLPPCDDLDLRTTTAPPELKMLPCTVTVDGREACNLHVTDGVRVLSVRKKAFSGESEGHLDTEDDWHVGPSAQVVAARPMVVDREKHTYSVVLTVQAVMLLTPAVLDESAHSTTDGERLQSELKRAASPSDLEAYLRSLVGQPAKGERLKQTAIEQLNRAGLQPSDVQILFCVLVKQIEEQVVDAPAETRQSAAPAAGSEKDLLTVYLDHKERTMKQIRAKLEHLMPEQRGLLEAMERLGDRVRACNKLLRDPSLVPGGTSVLAQAIQLTVNRKDSWLGENALRPWAVALRSFASKNSRVADVLLGLRGHLEQLCDADLPLPTLAAALGDSLKVCRTLLESLRPRMGGTLDTRAGVETAPDFTDDADIMGVEHLVNHSALSALGGLVDIVQKVCIRCLDKARAAGSPADPRVLALKGSLLEFQMLHLEFYEYGHQMHCFDKGHVDLIADSWCACSQRYMELWQPQELDCVTHRVKLASKLASTHVQASHMALDRAARTLQELALDTLVQVALHELPSRQAICEHNDRFAKELRQQQYGVRLLRALVDTRPPESLWNIPFGDYDFSSDLETMLRDREQQKGPSNVRWIAGLRARDVCRKMGKGYDTLQSLNDIAHNMSRMGGADLAPDIYAHMALNGLARISSEASRRRMNPASSLLPIDLQVKGSLLNAAVQLREGGVRRPCDAVPGVGTTVESMQAWDIPTTARECVKAADAQLRDAAGALPSSEMQRGRQRLLTLLRDGMAMLGHWPHDPGAAEPSREWLEVYGQLLNVAARADDLDPYSRHINVRIHALLVSEAGLIDSRGQTSEEAWLGAPHRHPHSMAWPTTSVQYSFARQNVSR